MSVFRAALCCTALMLCAIGAAPKHRASAPPPPPERTVVTHHTIELNGRAIPYAATAGTLTIKNDSGDATASMFYTAYTAQAQSDRRPVTFLFNGGPGSSSIWLRMGSVGPKRVRTPEGTAALPAPFALDDNPYSLLDKSDLVFVDAVGTGFSKVVGKGTGKDFWGVDEDVATFGQFIQSYLSRNGRWNSPKFLFGESYGTTRSANLVNYLQNKGTSFNGVVLVSTVLNFDLLIPQAGGSDASYVAFLPTEAATAWYHNKIANRPADIGTFVQTVRSFASGEYADALLKGDNVTSGNYADVVAKLHAYTGLSESYIRLSKLRIPPGRFQKELLRESDQATGRLDGRYLGYDLDTVGDSNDYDPSDVAVSGAFVGAFNNYIRKDLNYATTDEYKPTNYGVVNRGWNWNRGRSSPAATDVAGDLQEAMTKNPHLRVFAANGYYDMATPFYGTEMTLSHLGLPAALQPHITYGFYESGHMIYLNTPSLAKLKSDLSRFYDSAIP